MWSISASRHPISNSKNGLSTRVSNYRQYFIELNFQGFDFTNRFKCSGVHRFNKLTKLSVNLFEITFNQNQNKWKHKLTPVEVSKNNSAGVIDLSIYKNI